MLGIVKAFTIFFIGYELIGVLMPHVTLYIAGLHNAFQVKKVECSTYAVAKDTENLSVARQEMQSLARRALAASIINLTYWIFVILIFCSNNLVCRFVGIAILICGAIMSKVKTSTFTVRVDAIITTILLCFLFVFAH